MPLSTYALITVEEAKTHLKVSGSGQDSRIEALVNGASFAIEDHCENRFVRRAYTDSIFKVSGKKLRLTYPAHAVESISDQDDPETEIDAEDYYVHNERGILIYKHGNWPRPVGWWDVVYTAGLYGNTAAVPEDLKLACKILVAILYQNPGQDLESKKIGDLVLTFREREEWPLQLKGILDFHSRIWV